MLPRAPALFSGNTPQTLGVGLIGTGFMGKAHALACRTAKAVMGNLPDIRLVAHETAIHAIAQSSREGRRIRLADL